MITPGNLPGGTLYPKEEGLNLSPDQKKEFDNLAGKIQGVIGKLQNKATGKVSSVNTSLVNSYVRKEQFFVTSNSELQKDLEKMVDYLLGKEVNPHEINYQYIRDRLFPEGDKKVQGAQPQKTQPLQAQEATKAESIRQAYSVFKEKINKGMQSNFSKEEVSELQGLFRSLSTQTQDQTIQSKVFAWVDHFKDYPQTVEIITGMKVSEFEDTFFRHLMGTFQKREMAREDLERLKELGDKRKNVVGYEKDLQQVDLLLNPDLEDLMFKIANRGEELVKACIYQLKPNERLIAQFEQETKERLSALPESRAKHSLVEQRNLFLAKAKQAPSLWDKIRMKAQQLAEEMSMSNGKFEDLTKFIRTTTQLMNAAQELTRKENDEIMGILRPIEGKLLELIKRAAEIISKDNSKTPTDKWSNLSDITSLFIMNTGMFNYMSVSEKNEKFAFLRPLVLSVLEQTLKELDGFPLLSPQKNLKQAMVELYRVLYSDRLDRSTLLVAVEQIKKIELQLEKFQGENVQQLNNFRVDLSYLLTKVVREKAREVTSDPSVSTSEKLNFLNDLIGHTPYGNLSHELFDLVRTVEKEKKYDYNNLEQMIIEFQKKQKEGKSVDMAFLEKLQELERRNPEPFYAKELQAVKAMIDEKRAIADLYRGLAEMLASSKYVSDWPQEMHFKQWSGLKQKIEALPDGDQKKVLLATYYGNLVPSTEPYV